MHIAIPLYAGYDAMDALGPYFVLRNIPGATVTFVAERPGVIPDEEVTLTATASFADVPRPDVVVVPGTRDVKQSILDEALIHYVKTAHATTTWTTSVCVGSLALGAAGLLEGVRATTHWVAHDLLVQFGAQPVDERFVQDGKIITSAGVLAGIDMALHLASLLAGEDMAMAIQLGLEYAPQPPFNAGTPKTAPEEITAFVRSVLRPA
ncbi:glutamine amidotransferase [Planotetraspora thailandica]|uniref:Glutamine amidotransferase n=1 Tax=Planotetraspora thailandica TaxID=487172 RepID=A0A8J3XST4_9ACTN|nr:DJ-1/PfpI family protein [Planotetraspora thailandica]GII53587.1 glutamine amidotransferase [Planotetraspora thailandica]